MANFQKNTRDQKEYEAELERQLKIQNDIQWDKRYDKEICIFKICYDIIIYAFNLIIGSKNGRERKTQESN